MKKRSPQVRGQQLAVFLTFIVFVLGGLLVLIFKFDMFFLRDRQAGQESTAEREVQREEFEGRKNIYDRNFEEFAVSFRRSSLYARPLELQDPADAARQLATALEADEKNLLSSLKSERSFVWLGRDISWAKAEEITNFNMRGVYRLDQVHRFYPGGELASHVIGFMQDDQGLAGVESYYDNVLRGGNVYDTVLADAGVSKSAAAGKGGAHLVLTLDSRLQSLLEKDLRKLLEVTAARAASAIIMIPDSGEILGLVNIPAYDPNRFWDYGTEERKNRAIVDTIDLGGLERLFRTAAALDQQQVVLLDAEGDAAQGGSSASAPWTWLREGVYASGELAMMPDYDLEPAKFLEFAYKTGLSGKEVDLPDELSLVGVMDREETGEEKSPKSGGRSIARLGSDQTLSQNAASVLTAFCRIINGGKPMTPHVLGAIWDEKKLWYLPLRLKEGRGTMKPGASQAIVRYLAEKKTAVHDETLIMESIIEKRTDSGAQPQETETAAAGDAMKKGKNFNLVLLGMIMPQAPEAALVITLEEAVIDPLAESPARKVASGLLGKARRYASSKREIPTTAELSAREDSNYLKWQIMEVQARSKTPLPQDQQQTVMPGVIGQSLRVALQILQPYDLKIRLSGTGRVVAQHPAAGSSLTGVEECVLELKDR